MQLSCLLYTFDERSPCGARSGRRRRRPPRRDGRSKSMRALPRCATSRHYAWCWQTGGWAERFLSLVKWGARGFQGCERVGKAKNRKQKTQGGPALRMRPRREKNQKKIRLGVQNQNPENCPWEPPSHTVWTAQNDGKMCFEVFFPQNFRPPKFRPQNFRLRRCERVLKVM